MPETSSGSVPPLVSQSTTQRAPASKAARAQESVGSARHAIEPKRDLKDAAKEDFVKLVADELAVEHGRGQYDQLVLIAPPGVLTELKRKLAKPIADIVVKDLQKDLTKVPDHDLTGHLLD